MKISSAHIEHPFCGTCFCQFGKFTGDRQRGLLSKEEKTSHKTAEDF